MGEDDMREAWADVVENTYTYQGDFLMFADGVFVGTPKNKIWFEEMNERYSTGEDEG